MKFISVRSRVKDYDIYLKSEKMVHSNQKHEKFFRSNLELEKSGSQLFRACKTLLQLFREREKWIPAIWRPIYVVHNCQEQGKRFDIHLKSEHLVHSNYYHEKNVSELFGIGQKQVLAIASLINIVAAIWSEEKVDPCYLKTKKCSS